MAYNAGEVFAEVGAKFSPAGFNEFDAQMKRSAAAAEAFESRVSAANKRMGASTVSATRQAAASTRAMDDINKRAARSAEQLGHAAKVTAAGGLIAVGAAAGVAIKQAADFERGLRNVNSLAKLSETQLKGVSRELLTMATQTGQAPKTLSDGLYQIVSSGFSARDGLKVLRASAIAATAGLTDTGTAATAIAGAINAYGLKASDAAHVSDVLFQTVNRGVVNFHDLAQVIGPILPFARNLGVNLEQVGGAMSTLTKEGLPAAEAATALKNVFSQFLKNPKDLAAAIKQTGYESGPALIKAKGLQGALEALRKTTGDNSLAFKALFPDIRASTAAFGLTGKAAAAARKDLEFFTPRELTGVSKNVFAEQAKSASFQFQQLKATLSAVAITVGNAVLPQMNKLAASASRALSGFFRSGQADQLGASLSGAFSTIGQVARDTAPVVEHMAAALLSVGRAVDIGSASHLEAMLAGFVAFKGVSMVAPILLRLGSAMQTVALAARTAPTISAFFADLSAGGVAGPIGIAAAGVAGLAAAFVLLSHRESDAARAAREDAAAHRDLLASIKGLRGDEESLVQTRNDAKQSTLDLHAAEKARSDYLASGGKKNTAEYAQLNLNVATALDTNRRNHERLNTVLQKTAAQQSSLATSAFERLRNADRDIEKLQRRKLAEEAFNVSGQATKKTLDELAAAQKRRNQAVADFQRGTGVADIKDVDTARLAAGQSPIDPKFAQGVNLLAASIQRLPKTVQTKLLLSGDQDALSRLGDVASRLVALGKQHDVDVILKGDGTARQKLLALTAVAKGVPTSRVVAILANTDSARGKVLAMKALIAGVPAQKVAAIVARTSGTGEVNALRAAINAVQSRQVTVAVNTIRTEISRAVHFGPRAAGRGAGQKETALVGEGRVPRELIVNPAKGYAFAVNQPTIMGLDAGDYVLPTDRMFRGRALGFLADIASQLGVQAFAKGRKPTHKAHRKTTHRKVPPPGQYLRLSVDDFANKVQADDTQIQADKTRLDKLKEDAKQKFTKGPNKGKPTKTAQRARAELAAARRRWERDKQQKRADQRVLNDARKYQRQIDDTIAAAELARTEMDNADKRDDDAGFKSAQGRREAALKHLDALYRAAQKYAKGGSVWARTLAQNIAANQGDLLDNAQAAQAAAPDSAAQRLADTGMTDAEAAQMAGIDKDIALAALTSGLDDDTAAASAKVSFLRGILGEVMTQPARGGDTTIADIADQLKSAQDNLASLTGSGSTINENADVQAQLDQANQRAASSAAEAAANAAYLKAFGSGDIGSGGPDALRAAQGGPNVVQNFNLLHPGDPATQRAIGDIAVSGMGYQAYRRSSTFTPGI